MYNISGKGGIGMSERQIPLHVYPRDYSKPIVLNLQGEEGFRAYVEMVTSPRVEYDAKAAAEKAAENLRKQGLKV